MTSCSNGILTIQNATDLWFVWSGETEYDINAGTAAANYSFRGADPHSKLTPILSAINSLTYSNFLKRQVNDYTQGTSSSFSLNLGQRADYDHSTDELLVSYQASQLNGQTTDKGRTLLEWLLFNYGRHLMFSSARGNLPANLQGVWSFGSWAPWSGATSQYQRTNDVLACRSYGNGYHTNTMGLCPGQKTVVPRGSETAQILYNVSKGWAMHDETFITMDLQIFGSTGMKGLDIPNYNPGEWTNYAGAGAWLMTHVWDHFDYTGDVDWLRRQGYPLLKVTTQFWLEALQNDGYTKDNSLVAVPCNSPELPQTTFGCTHWQQLIWELFNAVEKSLSVLNLSSENAFLSEWRLDLDNSERLTHRHLSHLVGLYPSYSISSFDPQTDGIKSGNLTKQGLIAASNVALNMRGNGTSPDADAGWGKIWRAACWAQLGDVSRNFASNLFSLYNPFNTAENTLFQMDANGGYPAAVLVRVLYALKVIVLISTNRTPSSKHQTNQRSVAFWIVRIPLEHEVI
ncbi:13429_t:CDS:10, partial [Acaulospora colombiana]